jgi:hypothetical protein
MLAGCLSLREVEALTEEMGEMGRQYVTRRVPDTTLWDVFPRLAVEELRAQNRRQVRMFWRSKSLEPEGLPCGVASFDGKGLGALEHNADGDAQKVHRQDGSAYWLSRMLRVVLTSSAAKPCLDQIPIGAKTNEVASFGGFFDDVVAAYDPLFEIVTGDAGLTSKANADRVHEKGKAYVFALKDNQPELLAEAKRLLLPRVQRAPDAESEWETYQGKMVQRRIYRTHEIAGYHGWHHLQQAWLVEQLTRDKDGKVTIVEQRFFATSLRRGRLSSAQSLLVVRGHWGIENNCFWSLDTQWKEDAVPWCASGKAIEVVSWLRLMAYNLLQLARKRHLRARSDDGSSAAAPAWSRIFEWVRQARLP